MIPSLNASTLINVKLRAFASKLFYLGKNGYPTHHPTDDFLVFLAYALEQLADTPR
jgi:hypothetical protein